MSYDPTLNARIARERYQDYLREAERSRLFARSRAGRPSLPRRAARPLGKMLLRLGARLLRYSQAGQPAVARPYHPSVRSIELH